MKDATATGGHYAKETTSIMLFLIREFKIANFSRRISVYVPVPKPTLRLRLQNEFKIIMYRTEYIVNNSPIWHSMEMYITIGRQFNK